MLERSVEDHFCRRLKRDGFDVLKLRTPGNRHVMDRMILMPMWAPGPPEFVEVKRPGEKPRRAQLETAIAWGKRGVTVRPFISTIEEADALADKIIAEALARRKV